MNTPHLPRPAAPPLASFPRPTTGRRTGAGTGRSLLAGAAAAPGAGFGLVTGAARSAVGRALRAALALTLLGAAASSSPAGAQTNYYNLLGGWSEHFGVERDLNEVHWGLGLEVEHELGDWTVGGTVLNFTNSYRDRSTFAGAVGKRCFRPDADWRACVGVTAGVVNGYENHKDGGFMPAASAVADLSYRGFGAAVVCGPTPDFNGVCLALVRVRLFSPEGH